MKRKKIIMAILLAVFIMSGWQLISYFNTKNSNLKIRAIPEHSEILKAMQAISTDSKNYQKYVQTLRDLSDNYPVSRQIIIDNLTLTKIYDQEKITVTESQSRTIGQFNLTPYTIVAVGITTQHLDMILELAQNLSVTTPTINISNTSTINATITIFGLSYNRNEQ